MKIIQLALLIIIPASVFGQADVNQIINKSIQFHDPEGQWQKVALKMIIDEPRTSWPERHSELLLNNQNGNFSLKRNPEGHNLKWLYEDGKSSTFMDQASSETLPADSVSKYRLQPTRTEGYKQFYSFTLGLPMSLKTAGGQIKHEVEQVGFYGQTVYAVTYQLEKPLISSTWVFYFDTNTYQLLGCSLLNDETGEPAEYLKFDKILIETGGLKLPRVKHWFDADDHYLGSDIVVTCEVL